MAGPFPPGASKAETEPHAAAPIRGRGVGRNMRAVPGTGKGR